MMSPVYAPCSRPPSPANAYCLLPIAFHNQAMSGRPDLQPACKACKRTVTWDTVRRLDREVQPRVIERAYVCPYCRAVLEFASWQTGTRRR